MKLAGLPCKLTTVFILMAAFTGWCAAADETCIQEKKLLLEKEAGQCSGLPYIFNPSACFNTRKALSAYSKACPGGSVPTSAVTTSNKPDAVSEPQQQHQAQPSDAAPAENISVVREIAQLKSDLSQLREELGQLREKLSTCRCPQK